MEGDHVVTVLVSTELLAELEDWSAPVQARIRRSPGMHPEYTMDFRTHTCCTCPAWPDVTPEMRDETGQHLATCPRGGACKHGVPAGDVCKVCG